MPANERFTDRLYPLLPEIIEKFGTPFHIYDEQGIADTVSAMYEVFSENGLSGYRNYYSVKANPNLAVMRVISDAAGEEFGFDCSSTPELILARKIATGARIMFSSNNTSPEEFEVALGNGSCILNVDDLSLLEILTPEQLRSAVKVSFRYNPGSERSGDAIIGQPEEAKYGLRKDQLLTAYRHVLDAGVSPDALGIHTMIISNQREKSYMLETVKMMLGIAGEFLCQHKIKFKFINIGGGVGIPYRTNDSLFDMKKFAEETAREFLRFGEQYGYTPKLFMECGRYITGPHGVLVTKVLNRMSKHKEYVGVDACMSSLMRPAMYDAYHHITVLDRPDDAEYEVVDVVGSLCENNDKFAKNRHLPKTARGDVLVIHDTGAHGHAMGFNYNGRLRPKELLLTSDNTVKLIRRAETYDDYVRTLEI